jgi:hypothetical protein
MSRVADFDRGIAGMRCLFERVSALCDGFFDTVAVENPTDTAEAFKLYDMLLTQRSVLSAMLCSAETIGTHGSALVDGQPCPADQDCGCPRDTRTLTVGDRSSQTTVSPMPTPELWFETLLARSRKNTEKNTMENKDYEHAKRKDI